MKWHITRKGGEDIPHASGNTALPVRPERDAEQELLAGELLITSRGREVAETLIDPTVIKGSRGNFFAKPAPSVMGFFFYPSSVSRGGV